MVKAITDYGYSQMEVASFVGLHYSTISRIVAEVGEQRK
jgi:transposase